MRSDARKRLTDDPDPAVEAWSRTELEAALRVEKHALDAANARAQRWRERNAELTATVARVRALLPQWQQMIGPGWEWAIRDLNTALERTGDQA